MYHCHNIWKYQRIALYISKRHLTEELTVLTMCAIYLNTRVSPCCPKYCIHVLLMNEVSKGGITKTPRDGRVSAVKLSTQSP